MPSPTELPVPAIRDRAAVRNRAAIRSTPRRRFRRHLRRVAISVTVLFALLASAVAGSALLFHNAVGSKLTTIPDSQVFPADDSTRPAPSTGAKNILFLGSDSRQPVGERDIETAGSGRSDVVMLVHIPADRKGVSVMSLMRDLYVPVPGRGQAKINSAFAWGGTPLVIQTVENLLGARIDHVAIIDFEGLSAMTTALGGVTVDNPRAFTAKHGSDRFFPAGEISLQGERALSFVRERYAFATGDYQRVANQQRLLKGMIARALSRDILANPAALLDFAGEASKNLSVDAGFTMAEAASLAYSLRGVDLGAFDFFTVPTAGTGMVGGQSVVKVDEAKTQRLRAALADDTVPTFIRDDVEKRG